MDKTILPFKATAFDDNEPGMVLSSDGEILLDISGCSDINKSMTECVDLATFIATACNSHDALLEALKQISEMTASSNQDQSPKDEQARQWHKMKEIAKKAISQAEAKI
jgi:hypothetical protein